MSIMMKMIIYRSNKLFLALGAGDTVDDMPRLKYKSFHQHYHCHCLHYYCHHQHYHCLHYQFYIGTLENIFLIKGLVSRNFWFSC